MNLEQALHQRWSEHQTLNTLLPVHKVTTGRATGAALPCATILRRSRRTVCRTNSGDTIDEILLELRLLHESFDDAVAIVQRFLAAFDRSHFSLPGGGTVLSLRRTQEHARQLDDGSWQFQVEMLARLHLPPP